MEMPGLWKEWKAKGRLPTLPTSPLEISPKDGEIPTFPQLRRRRRMEKWKTKDRFSTFPPPRIYMSEKQTTKPRGRGTGLGLSLSYTIVQEHRGEMSVESRPGEGTVFTVDLPFEGRDAVHA